MLSPAPARERADVSGTFWNDLVELCRISRLVLVSLENDDLGRAAELCAASEILHARVRPVVERMAREGRLGDEAGDLGVLLASVRTMNEKIVDVLAEKKESSARALEETREARIRLSWHRGQAVQEPSRLDLCS